MAFREQGFTHLHGNDLSQEMIDVALAREIYDEISLVDLNNPLDFAQGQYDVIAAVGVISVGHAPASTIAEMFDKLHSGGLFIYSINDASIAEGSFVEATQALLARDNATLCEAHYGAHLPKINMQSTVYVVRRI